MRLLPDMPTTLHIQGLEAQRPPRRVTALSLSGKRTEKWHQIGHPHACSLSLGLSTFGSTALLGRFLPTLPKNSSPIME